MHVAGQHGEYNLCHFWSNFEIGDLRFFRSEAYQEYFSYLDRSLFSHALRLLVTGQHRFGGSMHYDEVSTAIMGCHPVIIISAVTLRCSH